MTTVAAFDVDKTLTRRDCVRAFIEELLGRNRLLVELLRHSPSLVTQLRDRDALKAIVSDIAFRGRDAADVARLGAAFAQRIHANWMRPDTWARLEWHRDQHHHVVLVSASYEVYLAPLAALLGIDAALGTRLQTNAGTLTGVLDGPNCRGVEKVRRVDEWMHAVVGGRSAVTLWAYGDSGGDRALLAAADHAVWVRGPITRVPRGSHEGRTSVADHGR